ncbi:hypothetical protein [Halobacteriovorax sp. DPLXC-1]|uniref:hypothetical protein n=1 Tax=Halobacteriovorax sp. DPLXC-1 TaxID=3110771 RepID=UPI002FF29129
MTNTWALRERALFSINGKIYFTKEANFLLKAYQYSKCSIDENKNKDYFNELVGKLSTQEGVEAAPLVPNDSQIQRIKKIMLIGKLLSLEHEFLSTPKFEKCKVPKAYRKTVEQIFNTNLELAKRYKSFINNKDIITPESLVKRSTSYRTHILKDIQSRLFL